MLNSSYPTHASFGHGQSRRVSLAIAPANNKPASSSVKFLILIDDLSKGASQLLSLKEPRQQMHGPLTQVERYRLLSSPSSRRDLDKGCYAA